MATMLFPQITEIWRRLPLPHADLVEEITAAMRAARAPHASLLDCPWNHGTDRYSRACRVAWRVAFRSMREHACVRLITMNERRAA
jgi:hypothetical protein